MLFPATATPDARRLVVARALRGFADGLVSVLLATHLAALGLSGAQVGAVVTATLLGSAALTLAVGLGGQRLPERSVLLAASLLMFATGLAFAGVAAFPLLLLVAFVGTLNPSGGDVSVFLPTEQSLLAANVGAGGSHRAARPLQPRRHLPRRARCARDRRAVARRARKVRRSRDRSCSYGAVAIAIAALYLGLAQRSHAARGAGRRRATRRGAQRGAAAHGALLARLVRRRLRRRFAGRAVAVPPLRSLARSDGRGVLRRAAAVGVLAARLVVAGARASGW